MHNLSDRFQTCQDGQRVSYDIVGGFALDINDKTNSARIMLELRIVQALSLRNPISTHITAFHCNVIGGLVT